MLKVAGEVNLADLFTKHLDSNNKLDQVVGLFSCRFLEGRAAIAPTQKSDSAVHLAHNPVLLPHQHLPEDIAELFTEAIPDSPRRGEDDDDLAEELSDPVPALQASSRRVPAANATRDLPSVSPGYDQNTEVAPQVSRAEAHVRGHWFYRTRRRLQGVALVHR